MNTSQMSYIPQAQQCRDIQRKVFCRHGDTVNRETFQNVSIAVSLWQFVDDINEVN
jgi:hypothetical protein